MSDGLSAPRQTAMRTLERLVTQGGDICPVCYARADRRIDVDVFSLYRCRACGAWSSDALARGAATSFQPSAYFDNPEIDKDKWDHLLSRLGDGDAAPAAVLDVGCGTGDFLAYLSKRHPIIRTEGVELDSERAAEARKRAPTARIYTGDAIEALDRADGPFDLITMWDVLEHVPAPTELLTRLARLLSPGGVIYAQTIHESSLVPTIGRWSYRLSGGRLRYPVRRTHDAHHAGFFTIASLRRSAQQAELRIRELWFDRLALGRMDGNAALKALTALMLRAENALGGGLFVNIVAERTTDGRSAGGIEA